MDNKTRILLILPVVLFILVVLAANYVPFRTELSEAEKQILAFTPSKLRIEEREKIFTLKNIKSPFDFSASKAILRTVKRSEAVEQTGLKDVHLTLIVISGNSKTAIINGKVVKEGDRIDDKRIVKIEPDRVLLKDKTLKWVYLKK